MKRVQSTIKMVNIKENRMLATEIKCDIKDINLEEKKKNQIDWAFKDMPVLKTIRE